MDRLQLDDQLRELAPNVYFQPKSNVGMEYPCIVYQWAKTDTRFAGNKPYRHFKRFTVTVIDRNPDSPIPDLVADLPQCANAAFFVAENLNHHVFDIFI